MKLGRPPGQIGRFVTRCQTLCHGMRGMSWFKPPAYEMILATASLSCQLQKTLGAGLKPRLHGHWLLAGSS